jgi:uncharacterized protein YjdB
MFVRRRVLELLPLFAVAAIIGCGNPQGLDSVQVSPGNQALVVGQTAQFTATGTYGNANHQSTQIITGSVTWSSATPSVATVNAAGLATAVGAGTTTITASAAGYAGPISSSATITVTSAGGGVAGGSIVSIAIIPGSQSVSAPGQTSQFIAIGTTTSGATINVSNQVAWSSSSTTIATIGATTGLATAVGQGSTTIAALYSSSGTVVTGTATFSVSGGVSEKYTGVSITPSGQALSASGQTTQLVALGTLGSSGLLTNVTTSSQLAWVSTSPSIATVSPTGLVTGVAPGTDTILAELTNTDGTVVTGTATLNVSVTPAPEPLLSLTVIPSSITVLNLLGTGQFLAIGTYSTPPYVRDVTNLPSTTWISDVPSVFTVDTNAGGNSGATAGLVTAYGSGSAVIIAETKATDGTIQTATAQFNCPLALPNPNGNPPTPGTCIQGTQAPALLATLTIYNEGLNTTSWLVTAASATGTQNVIHCGPAWGATGNTAALSETGGSVCTATYPIGTVVTLTAPANGGFPVTNPLAVAFGGWSYNCLAVGNVTAAGPNTCTVVLSQDDTVGAIFN